MRGVRSRQGGELAECAPVEGLPEGCKGDATEGWNRPLSIADCRQQTWQLLHLYVLSLSAHPRQVTTAFLHAMLVCYQQACQGIQAQHFHVALPMWPQ